MKRSVKKEMQQPLKSLYSEPFKDDPKYLAVSLSPNSLRSYSSFNSKRRTMYQTKDRDYMSVTSYQLQPSSSLSSSGRQVTIRPNKTMQLQTQKKVRVMLKAFSIRSDCKTPEKFAQASKKFKFPKHRIGVQNERSRGQFPSKDTIKIEDY